MSDLISIIIPVYNAGKTIDGCVESVLKSTYSDFEILIIDDDWRGSISKYFAPVMALLFTIATVLYTEFMKGNLFPGFDIYNFTTGRDYILSLWNQINYMSYGYGSSMVLIGRYLEMDLVQIYMELNIIAVFAFSYVYFKIAGENVYSILVMTYAFFNMLTASSLPGSLSWIVAFLTIASVSSDKCRQENITINEEKSHVKKLFSKKKGTRNNVQASVSYYSTSVR